MSRNVNNKQKMPATTDKKKPATDEMPATEEMPATTGPPATTMPLIRKPS